MTKRIFDFLFSLLGLFVLLPLFLIIAIWIKLDSKGNVFYKQTRVGKFNKDFKILKFRSMIENSSKKGLLTIGNHDNRITRSGYYLRKTKLDELPQLINVLMGDMSLVGPRPEVRKYVNMYNEQQMGVLKVRPGITDVASIHYRNENELLNEASNPEKFYIDTVMPNKLEINLQYLERRNLLSDFKVIMDTILKVLK